MARITDLPTELLAEVFHNLDNVRFLPPVLLVCKDFHHLIINQRIAQEVLVRQITPALMAHAVGVLEASEMVRSHSDASIKESVELSNCKPSQLRVEFQTASFGKVLKMGRLHDVIETFAADFMGFAWKHFSVDEPKISSAEHSRACRAFYRVELFFILFREHANSSDSDSVGDEQLFLQLYKPWEREQLACVQSFLERTLREKPLPRRTLLSREEEDEDKDQRGEDEDKDQRGEDEEEEESNLLIDLTSQGLLFIHRITSNNEESPSPEIQDLINGRDLPRIDLADAIAYNLRYYYRHRRYYKPGTIPDSGDLDAGPSLLWNKALVELAGSYLLDEGLAFRRKVAFVFWDEERIDRDDLLRRVTGLEDLERSWERSRTIYVWNSGTPPR